MRGEAAARIEHDAQRIRTRHPARGEARIVGGDGAGTDDDRIGQRTQPMQMIEVLLAGHERGLPRRRGDAAIEALAELRHHERACTARHAQRQVEFDERPRRIVGAIHAPALRRMPVERDAVRGEVPRLARRAAAGMACSVEHERPESRRRGAFRKVFHRRSPHRI